MGVGEAPVQLRREGPQLGVGAAGLTWPVGPLGRSQQVRGLVLPGLLGRCGKRIILVGNWCLLE